jgi:hypothetical protein
MFLSLQPITLFINVHKFGLGLFPTEILSTCIARELGGGGGGEKSKRAVKQKKW